MTARFDDDVMLPVEGDGVQMHSTVHTQSDDEHLALLTLRIYPIPFEVTDELSDALMKAAAAWLNEREITVGDPRFVPTPESNTRH